MALASFPDTYSLTLTDRITTEVSRPGHVSRQNRRDDRVFFAGIFPSIGFIILEELLDPQRFHMWGESGIWKYVAAVVVDTGTVRQESRRTNVNASMQTFQKIFKEFC